jgi:tRNA (guanine-N7-)-methyltransferase
MWSARSPLAAGCISGPVKDYYDGALELIARCTPLVGPLEVAEKPAEHDLDFRTHFERRMRLHELPVYRSEFVKAKVDV